MRTGWSVRHSVMRRPFSTRSATGSPVALTCSDAGTVTSRWQSNHPPAIGSPAAFIPSYQCSGHSRGSALFLSSSTPTPFRNPSCGASVGLPSAVSTMLLGSTNSISDPPFLETPSG